MNGAISNIQPVGSGVPQGTVLGPSLFLFYVNIVDNISSDIRLFADDVIFYSILSEKRVLINFKQMYVD